MLSNASKTFIMMKLQSLNEQKKCVELAGASTAIVLNN